LFFITSITVGYRFFVVPGVRCGWGWSGSRCRLLSPALGMDVSPVDICVEGEVRSYLNVGGGFELIAYLLVNLMYGVVGVWNICALVLSLVFQYGTVQYAYH
jgi:hypothetical protein